MTTAEGARRQHRGDGGVSEEVGMEEGGCLKSSWESGRLGSTIEPITNGGVGSGRRGGGVQARLQVHIHSSAPARGGAAP